MDMGAGSAIDEKAEQFGPTVVSAGVHESLAFVDQCEVQIRDHLTLTGAQGLTEQFALWRDDRGEAATRERSQGGARVGHDLRLLIGIQPCCRGNHKDTRLKRVIARLDLGLSREQVAENRSR